MKVTRARQLSAGQYMVRFSVSDFSPDEIGKMNSFGIPVISMIHMTQGLPRSMNFAINQINNNIYASFGTEQEAINYEENVMKQLTEAIKSLRERKDTFTSSDTVDL
jgi:hypothetical protein